jgi:hypothetical protein
MTDIELEELVEEIEEFIVTKVQTHKVTILNLTAIYLSRIALLSVECNMQKDFTYLLNSVADSVDELSREEKQKVTLQ